MTFERLKEICRNTKCGIGSVEWNIHCDIMGDGFFIQLRYLEKDIETGDLQDQHGRKWYVSKHSVKSEVVQTILKACLTSAEHMIREHFTYKEERIYGPHFDVDELVKFAASKRRDTRKVRT